MCFSVSHICAGAHRGQKRSDPLELEFSTSILYPQPSLLPRPLCLAVNLSYKSCLVYILVVFLWCSLSTCVCVRCECVCLKTGSQVAQAALGLSLQLRMTLTSWPPCFTSWVLGFQVCQVSEIGDLGRVGLDLQVNVAARPSIAIWGTCLFSPEVRAPLISRMR